MGVISGGFCPYSTLFLSNSCFTTAVSKTISSLQIKYFMTSLQTIPFILFVSLPNMKL